ncbi:TrmH family RNA methyltransferase [Candidatus Parcubacteria bacterium]|nr:TrmH family RNA methyltransferase [Candidatus Parcubacteria bacterium]
MKKENPKKDDGDLQSDKLGAFEFKSKTLSYDQNKPRNRADYLKWLTDEEVKKYLTEQKLNYGVLIMNLLYDNNAGNIVRSANAFGASEIILYGHKTFDRRASVGSEFYEYFRHIKFTEDIDAIFAEYEVVVAVENNSGAMPLADFKWNPTQKTLMIFGQESGGIPKEILNKCDHVVEISQFGSVRSLNVAVAAGIIMNDYCTKTRGNI